MNSNLGSQPWKTPWNSSALSFPLSRALFRSALLQKQVSIHPHTWQVAQKL